MKKTEIKPIVLTDNETGIKYTLEFTRDSVKFAQFKGFNIDDIDTKPMLAIPDLFYYSFRANHKNVSREKIDKLFEELGGMPSGMLERLIQLYYLPYNTLIADEDEGEPKNAKLTVEF